MADYVADLTTTIESELEELHGFLSALVAQPRFVSLEPGVIRSLPEQFHRLDAIRDAVRDLVFFGDVLDETRREVERALGKVPVAPDFEAETEALATAAEEEEEPAAEVMTEAVEVAPAPPPREPVARRAAEPMPSLQALTTRQYDLCAIWS